MDGYTVARKLKSDPELAAIPIVAVTSYAMVGDREKILGPVVQGISKNPLSLKLS